MKETSSSPPALSGPAGGPPFEEYGMRVSTVTNGCDLWHALGVAARLGCTITRRRGTGELFVRHPSLPKPFRVSGHRKDAPRVLTVLLRRLSARAWVA